jgi:hypothetical protein
MVDPRCLSKFTMPLTASSGLMPLGSFGTNALKMPLLPLQALANHWMLAAMLGCRKTLEIADRIVVPIPIDMMDLIATRDWPALVFPNMPVQKSTARLGREEVPLMRDIATVRIASIAIAAIDDEFGF